MMPKLKLLFSAALLLGLVACSSTPDKLEGEGEGVGADTAPGLNGVEVMPANGTRVGGEMLSDSELDKMNMSNVDDEFFGKLGPVIYFGLNEFTLSDDSTAIVKHYSQILSANPSQKVTLKGHTDERGSPEYNIALGERRGKAVAQAMMLFGVAENRIEVVSYGEEQPAVAQSNEEAWAKNRRVELYIR